MIVQTAQGVRFIATPELSGLGEATADDLADKVITWLKQYWYVPALAVVGLLLIRRLR